MHRFHYKWIAIVLLAFAACGDDSDYDPPVCSNTGDSCWIRKEVPGYGSSKGHCKCGSIKIGNEPRRANCRCIAY